MSTRTITLDCPNDPGDHEIEIEVEITSWGSRPSYDDPGDGAEYEYDIPKQCPECKHHFLDDEYKELHVEAEKKIDNSIGDWESDAAESAADARAEAAYDEWNDEGRPPRHPLGGYFRQGED